MSPRLRIVSTQKQCSKQKKQDLSEKRQSAINKRWSKQQAENQIAAAAAERAKAAGKIRLGMHTDKKRAIRSAVIPFNSSGQEEREVVWYATGDMKILSALYGHIGSASTHSCLLCEAWKESFRSNKGSSARTLYSIELGWPVPGTKANGGKKTRKNAAAGVKKKLNKEMNKNTKILDDRKNKSSSNVISRYYSRSFVKAMKLNKAFVELRTLSSSQKS
uniref:Uncharacterized protein n=1 Tax=Ditylenchus dipsaci TaxID=166011 RepID=A0A915ERK6_9BILA